MGLFDKGISQNLEDMMNARERRWVRQMELVATHGETLIGYKLNIPGEIKNNDKLQLLFDEGLGIIMDNLRSNDINVISMDISNEPSGAEAFIVVEENANKTKLHMCYIEDKFSIGRLMDIDVFNSQGEGLSRMDLGLSPRKCLICQKEVFECSRSRSHSVDDLREKITEIYRGYFGNRQEKVVKQGSQTRK